MIPPIISLMQQLSAAKKDLAKEKAKNIDTGVMPVQDEIITEYSTKYAPIVEIKKGVIIAKTGSGKTHGFIDQPDVLILVPRILQTNVFTGDDTDFLLNKIAVNGAIITYDKFYGHYLNNNEFRSAIDKHRITVIVDEAHTLVDIPCRKNKLIYNLDAVFMSGTLEKFFRSDIQRYKYKPTEREPIYYTNGLLPDIKGSLVFVDNAKALIHNYTDACIVSETRKHNNVNIHTTELDTVFSTSALREGISITNGNFTACMVSAKNCQLWSTKDIIQGLHRVRHESTLRIVSAPPKDEYKHHIDFDWWVEFVSRQTSSREMNAAFGEYYSKLIKTTHGQNKYIEADNYGIVCYLAQKTKNNYDHDFYEFVKYEHDGMPLKINTDTSGVVDDEDENFFKYVLENNHIWQVPAKGNIKFKKWVHQKNSGLIDKIMKIDKFVNFNDVYKFSKVSRHIREAYNKNYSKQKKKYSIDLFYKFLKDNVVIETRSKDGQIIQRISKNINLKECDIRAVSECAIEGANRVEN